MSGLVPVFVASNESEAEIVKTLLQSMGITADVFADDSGGMLLNLQLSQGVAVVVSESDKNEAEKIVERYRQGDPGLSGNEGT